MRKHRTRRPRRSLRGKGKFMDLLKKGNAFLKRTQVVSKVANALKDAGVAPKYTGAIGSTASKLGYGRRRRVGRPRKRRMRGKGKFMDFMRKANNWLKKTGVVSKVANTLGAVGVPYASAVGSVAGKLGYGRQRKGHRMRGRGNYLGTAPMMGSGMGGTPQYSVARIG